MTASATSDGDAVAPANSESPVGVLVVADIRLHRDGLAEILRRQQTIRALGTAADADEAVAQARSLSPQVILVDMVMRDDAMRTVGTLAREVPEARILALAVPEAEEEVIACVEAGAAGCVTRGASLEEVVSAVEGIARGEAPCSPLMTAAIFKRIRELAVGRPEGLEERLTPREQEILSLIDEGLSNKQIAQSLCIETATVKNHVHSILEKLHVTRRGEAAAAVRHRIGVIDGFSCVVPLILCHALDEPFGLVLSGPWN
jgi:two-component system, NarL family, nitrate/nitrite response regulator NarL